VPLPKAFRLLTPDAIRQDVRIRALALGAGLIPPRTMHTPAEAELLGKLAVNRRRVVEIGVYEGSSALVLVRSLPRDAVLHLIDPFVDSRGLAPGWRGTAWASQRVIARAARRSGPTIRWHIARSEQVGRAWSEPIDFVFIDGDHAPETCRLDWELFSPWVPVGGVVAFHDARQDRPGGEGLRGNGGQPGPTTLVDQLFRGPKPIAGWRLGDELDSIVAVERVA
jgi:predicted O-methyltransferase YrrM